MPEFRYPELDLAQSSIRLLYIKKGHLSDDISCSLVESILEEGQGITYKALSYTWGGLTYTPRTYRHLPYVFVNDHEFEITENLFSALQHIRSTSEDVILWTDAICINQANKQEKGHQVRQMGNIYKAAEEVLIWLGPSNDDIKDLIESIAWIDIKAIEAQGRGSCENWTSLCRRFMIERLGSLLSQPYSRQGRALSEILERRWFNRVWILQEVAMARMARIVCGPYSCPARTFALMPLLMGLSVNEHTQAVLDIMPRLRRDTWWSLKRHLHQLLVKFAGTSATDNRDKVYALLGMSEDAYNPARFYPSYEKSESQVFRDTACFLLLGEILDSNHSFPDFTFQELSRPIIKLAEKTLSWTLGQSEGQRESAQRTATLLIGRLNEGQLKKADLMLSLAEKHGQVGAVQNLLSQGSFEVDINFEDENSILRIISKEESVESVSLIFPREQLGQGKRPTETAADLEPLPFEKDENITETINRLIEVDASKEEVLRAYVWAGDIDGVHRLLEEGADINGSDNHGRTALQYAIMSPRWKSA